MRKWLSIMALVILIPPGTLALLHLAGTRSPRPWVRLAVVIGESMEPTFVQGDGIVFARLPWKTGDVVLANVGELLPVVKRVEAVEGDSVHIVGDNKPRSATYWLRRSKIMGRMAFRFGHFPALAGTAPKAKPVQQPPGP
jgi:signal peptidase I